MKRPFVYDPASRRAPQVLANLIRHIHDLGTTAMILVQEPTRTLAQNAKWWPMLNDIAKQKQLMVNGALIWAKPEDWKLVFMAALRKEMRVAQGIDGGIVLLGGSTRELSIREGSDFIELLYAYGSQHDIVWSEPLERDP